MVSNTFNEKELEVEEKRDNEWKGSAGLVICL